MSHRRSSLAADLAELERTDPKVRAAAENLERVKLEIIASAKPRRIQRKRAKGWRMPPNTVVVTRGSKWGNPFSVTTKLKPGAHITGGYTAVPTVEDAIDCYQLWLVENEHGRKIARDTKVELRGKHLACWCKVGAPCHGDILLIEANR